MDEIASLLRELIASTDETNRLLNEELNWTNDLSLGKQIMDRLDRIDSSIQSIEIS